MELKHVKKAYFDTNILIYLLEGNPAYKDKVISLVQQLEALNCELFTSELTLAECLVKPFADNDLKSQAIYQNALQQSKTLHVSPISTEILIKAARLRGELKNKLPDSIHLATAIVCGCDVFIGNDERIKTNNEIILYCLNKKEDL